MTCRPGLAIGVRGLVTAALLVISHAAQAVCVNPANPQESPKDGVEMFFNIHLPGREVKAPNGDSVFTRDGGSEEVAEGIPSDVIQTQYHLWGMQWSRGRLGSRFGIREASTTGKPTPVLEQIAFNDGEGDLHNDPDGRPPFVWPNHVDPQAFDQKKLSRTGGVIYYYEPNGGSGRRLCRVEYWLSRTVFASHRSDPPTIEKRAKAITVPASTDQTRNPVLAALSKDYFLAGYGNLQYNTQGLLPKIGPVCYHYTNDGQVRWIGYDDHHGRCLDKKPDPKKEPYIEIVFDGNGKGQGAFMNIPYRWRKEGEDARPEPEEDKKKIDPAQNGWVQRWKFVHRGSRVTANVNDRDGIVEIKASRGEVGAEDDNTYNVPTEDGAKTPYILNRGQHWRTYTFTHRVSGDLLRDLDALYQHERVRFTGTHLLEIAERFAAGSHQLLDRAWFAANGHLPRQEFFKDGKLVRAISIDFPVFKDPKLRYWEEDLTKYQGQLKMPVENVYIRVYDYDAQGKESLTAIGWTDYPRDKFFEAQSGSKRAILREYWEMVERYTGYKKEQDSRYDQMPAELTYYYGTPDGKVRWTNYDEFNKAFGPLPEQGIDYMFPERRKAH